MLLKLVPTYGWKSVYMRGLILEWHRSKHAMGRDFQGTEVRITYLLFAIVIYRLVCVNCGHMSG